MLHTSLVALDRLLSRLLPWQIWVLSTLEVALVFAADHLTGHEISISLLYLVPVATASWYAGRRASVSISILACISWFAADISAGHLHSHMAIPVWNALGRLGFFLVNGYLVLALKRSLSHERELALTDALTGVFGRRAFENRLEHDLDLARRNARPLTVAYIDVDDFKVLNDAHGHNVGDQALRVIGQTLSGATRRADTVARLGGDEFAVVLVDTRSAGAAQLVEKLRRDLHAALQPVAPELTCSIGAITFQDSVPMLQEAVSLADALMYQAKRQGKDQIVFRVATDSAIVPGRSDQGRSDQGRSDQGRSDQGRSDQGRSDQGTSDQGRSDQSVGK